MWGCSLRVGGGCVGQRGPSIIRERNWAGVCLWGIPWGLGGAQRRNSTLGGGGARCSIECDCRTMNRRQVSVTAGTGTGTGTGAGTGGGALRWGSLWGREIECVRVCAGERGFAAVASCVRVTSRGDRVCVVW